MLPKAHLTSHSRISGSRWVSTPSWLSGSWISFFVQFFCVFLPPLEAPKILLSLDPSPHQWGNLVYRNLSSSQRHRSCHDSLLSLFFILFYSVSWDFCGPLEMWGLLPALSGCSVRVFPYVDVFLLYLGRKWAPHLALLPSWSNPCSTDCDVMSRKGHVVDKWLPFCFPFAQCLCFSIS